MFLSAVLLNTVGKVEVACEKPESWTFEISSVEKTAGVDVVKIILKSEKEAMPPCFEVRWSVPQRDVHHLWSGESTHYGIPWREPHYSESTSWMPIYSFLDASDRNRYTFACSESCRRVDFRAPISETDMTFACSFRFFTADDAPLRRYEVMIRLDARDRLYSESIADAADWMCRAGGEALVSPEAAFEPVYSTWYDFHQDISSEMVERECRIAADLGMRTVIVDDGWQIDLPLGGRQWGGYRRCGDWKPGRNFPDMRGMVERIHALGMRCMLWYSVPFVGEDSANFGRFEGKYLPVKCAGGHVLDPRFLEVREFIARTYENAIRDWDLDGLKLDFIGRFALKDGVEDPALKEGFAGRDIKSIPVAVEVLFSDVLKRLRAIKPDILIEFRQPYVGPSIRRFGNMLRANDCPCSMVENRTRTARIRLAAGKTAVHSDMLEWRIDETPESAARCILNALFSVVQYSMHLDRMPSEHMRMVRNWIEFSRVHRKALLLGEFRAHYPANDYPLLEGESESERIFGVYQPGLVVDVGSADRTVFILNGTTSNAIAVRFSRIASVGLYNVFGEKVSVVSAPVGVCDIPVPLSGYAKIDWKGCGVSPDKATAVRVHGDGSYNSWPMIQSLGNRLVCAYSRGSEHSINEGRRGVWVKHSDDGGFNWSEETLIANDPQCGEVTIGRGVDENDAMLLWVRSCGNGGIRHELYRSMDGVNFAKISAPHLDPAPMQITDVVKIPGVGLMSLWFSAGYAYLKSGDRAWGTLVSKDNGETWTRATVESGLDVADWPTEPSAVYLGQGRILAVARSEGATRHQFQLVSKDYGRTWTKSRTNIRDVCESTPSLIYDSTTGSVFNYYYQRGARQLKCRVSDAAFIFEHPMDWPDPQTYFRGREERAFDAGNVNVTSRDGVHYAATYTGGMSNTEVVVVRISQMK